MKLRKMMAILLALCTVFFLAGCGGGGGGGSDEEEAVTWPVEFYSEVGGGSPVSAMRVAPATGTYKYIYFYENKTYESGDLNNGTLNKTGEGSYSGGDPHNNITISLTGTFEGNNLNGESVAISSGSLTVAGVSFTRSASSNGGSNGGNGGNGGSGGGNGGDNTPAVIPADFVKVNGGTVSGQIADSNIFIAGRTVQIRDLYVCDHEVTQKEFKQYMKLYEWNTSIVGDYHSESQGSSGMGDNYPVFWTSWYSAVMYCNLRSIAEGLTPVYYIEIDDKDETDVAKWLTALGPELDTYEDYQCFNCEDGKYYYNGPQSLAGNTQDKLNYYGDTDPDGGIRFNTSANGYRLPTEVEWEYIARGGNNGIPNTQYLYSGSDNPNGYVVGNGSTMANGDVIKTKLPNALGIYDMSGNAREWVWDWFKANVNFTASTPATGPESPDGGTGRVLRGGSHNNNIAQSKVNFRSTYGVPGHANTGAGFRVVRNAD